MDVHTDIEDPEQLRASLQELSCQDTHHRDEIARIKERYTLLQKLYRSIEDHASKNDARTKDLEAARDGAEKRVRELRHRVCELEREKEEAVDVLSKEKMHIQKHLEQRVRDLERELAVRSIGTLRSALPAHEPDSRRSGSTNNTTPSTKPTSAVKEEQEVIDVLSSEDDEPEPSKKPGQMQPPIRIPPRPRRSGPTESVVSSSTLPMKRSSSARRSVPLSPEPTSKRPRTRRAARGASSPTPSRGSSPLSDDDDYEWTPEPRHPPIKSPAPPRTMRVRHHAPTTHTNPSNALPTPALPTDGVIQGIIATRLGVKAELASVDCPGDIDRTFFTRAHISQIYGGSGQCTWVSVSEDKQRNGVSHYLCLRYEFNPGAPASPGALGVMFTIKKRVTHKVEKVFMSRQASEWCYIGDYELAPAANHFVSPAEWARFPLKMKKPWYKKVKGKQDEAIEIRARIALAHKHGREPTADEVQDMVAKGGVPTVSDDEFDAYVASGKECIRIWMMSFVGYDKPFQQTLIDALY